MVFFKAGILLPEGVRCCRDHLYMHELSFEALQKIQSSYADELFINADGIQKLLEYFSTYLGSSRSFDFDNLSSLDDTAYVTITGLHKSESFFSCFTTALDFFLLDNFDNLVDSILSMRNSRTRSV